MRELLHTAILHSITAWYCGLELLHLDLRLIPVV